MAKLIFLLDGNVVKEYLLDKERMTIGRRASSDIYIDNLAISGEHALLVTVDGDSYIEDLNSTNGTLVNKKTVKKHMLKHGDEIGLGKYALKFLNDGVANESASNGFSDTVLVEVESAVTSDSHVESSTDNIEAEPTPATNATVNPVQVVPEELEPAEPNVLASEQQEVVAETASSEVEIEADQSAPTDSVSHGPHLKTLSGEQAGSLVLLDKSMVKVGQPGEQVAVVTKRQNNYFITHVAGDHYPLINGEEIGAQAYALSHHDEIEVMGIKMEFLSS